MMLREMILSSSNSHLANHFNFFTKIPALVFAERVKIILEMKA